MIIWLPLLVALLGLLTYLLSVRPKIEELGRLAFFAGLLAFLFQVAGKSVDLLR